MMEAEEREFSLANKIKGIQQGCNEGNIIVDVDADDMFIGTQSLKIINYLYSESHQMWDNGVDDTWILYTNYLTEK